MSRRDDTVPMRHMLDYAREAVAMARERTRRDLGDDRVFQLALTHLIEIIGEAAARVSRDGQTRYADIPWPEIVATRNRIVHGYDSVDYDIVWRIATDELPALILALDRALPGHKGCPTSSGASGTSSGSTT
jgi:uncharacterized protein with HEPN domain